MSYYSYDYPSALTEERLAGIVCEGVKDYLSETTEYVKNCQKTIAEQQEIIDELNFEIEVLLKSFWADEATDAEVVSVAFGPFGRRTSFDDDGRFISTKEYDKVVIRVSSSCGAD